MLRVERAHRVMVEHRIGVRPLGTDKWWPDITRSSLSLEQRLRLSEELPKSTEDEDLFDSPVDAVMAVAGVLGLADF